MILNEFPPHVERPGGAAEKIQRVFHFSILHRNLRGTYPGQDEYAVVRESL